MEIDIFTLAHEIKNPLAISKGYLEFSNEKNFINYKEIIENNINEALIVLDSYLEYNKLNIILEEVDIIYILEELINNYQFLYNISINLISIYYELYMEADYNKLKQVFNNIFKNSIEAHAKKIDIIVKIVENYVNISIIDDGDSINNFDLLNGYSSKVNGNGIGVMITKKIISKHKGFIKYENNIDKGCKVLVSLPIKL